MEEILHHLGWLNPKNNGIIIILGGAGFCPSTVWIQKKHILEKEVPFNHVCF